MVLFFALKIFLFPNECKGVLENPAFEEMLLAKIVKWYLKLKKNPANLCRAFARDLVVLILTLL